MSSSQESSLKRRAASMKQLRPSHERHQFKKSFTMNKRSSHMIEEHQGSSSSLFSLFSDKKKSKASANPDAFMDSLDEQIAKIRGTLETMKMEDKCIGERVARVTAAIDAASESSNSSSLCSLESPSSTQNTKDLSSSVTSLPTSDSKRDSGFVFDLKFELVDSPKYCCLPNNMAPVKQAKKSKSTSAIDFIRNDLQEVDSCRRLKATSIDRLSCYSDSALLSVPGLRYR